MASIIVAGSMLLHNVIKDKKDAKREKKRQAYEERYNDLQREHSQHAEKHVHRQKSGGIQPTSRGLGSDAEKRRTSQSSLKTTDSDGPSQWVDDVTREKSKY